MTDQALDHRRGEMDIREQVATFELVMGMTKWGSLGIGALVLFLALWFCTGAGFMGAAVTAFVMIVAGVFLLREPKTASH
jgi:hypothetical protein